MGEVQECISNRQDASAGERAQIHARHSTRKRAVRPMGGFRLFTHQNHSWHRGFDVRHLQEGARHRGKVAQAALRYTLSL